MRLRCGAALIAVNPGTRAADLDQGRATSAALNSRHVAAHLVRALRLRSRALGHRAGHDACAGVSLPPRFVRMDRRDDPTSGRGAPDALAAVERARRRVTSRRVTRSFFGVVKNNPMQSRNRVPTPRLGRPRRYWDAWRRLNFSPRAAGLPLPLCFAGEGRGGGRGREVIAGVMRGRESASRSRPPPQSCGGGEGQAGDKKGPPLTR
jgi:hypothetical protein